MWKTIVLILLFVLVGLPILSVLVSEIEGSGLLWLALIAVAGVLFRQHRQLSALRQRLDGELAAVRQRLDNVNEVLESAWTAAGPAQRSTASVVTAAAPAQVPDPVTSPLPARSPEQVEDTEWTASTSMAGKTTFILAG